MSHQEQYYIKDKQGNIIQVKLLQANYHEGYSLFINGNNIYSRRMDETIQNPHHQRNTDKDTLEMYYF